MPAEAQAEPAHGLGHDGHWSHRLCMQRDFKGKKKGTDIGQERDLIKCANLHPKHWRMTRRGTGPRKEDFPDPTSPLGMILSVTSTSENRDMDWIDTRAFLEMVGPSKSACTI